MLTIQTAFGKKLRIRTLPEGYVQDENGHWWLLNQQRGWVPVPSNGRALLAALAEADKAS